MPGERGRSAQSSYRHSSTSIQERRAFFGCDMNTFWVENRVNCEFYNLLITSDMLRVFMGRTSTSTRTIDKGSEVILGKILAGKIFSIVAE
jgi:hypothetical protein